MDDPYQPGYPTDLRSASMRAREAAGPYGDFEAGAARVVARSTGFRTVIQDNNEMPRTPDFRIEASSEVVGLGEVVTTTVGPRAEQLRAFSKGNLQFDSEDLACTWWVTVTPRARQAGLERTLVDALASLEARGAHLRLNGLPSLVDPPPEIVRLERLGLTEIICAPSPRAGPGRIYGQPEGIGGPVRIDWLGCARWIDSFLSGELCQRKMKKLIEAGPAAQRHLYVGITSDVPWPVHQVLETRVSEVRLPPPQLPEGLTHLWLDDAEFPSRVLAWWPERGWFDVRTRWATE